MTAFEFRTVPDIQMEWQGASRLGEIIGHRFAARRALIVTDAGLAKTGLIEPIAENLRANNFCVTVFDETVADPPESVVLSGVQIARSVGIDIVIGIGGGSSLDVAKLVAILLVTDQPLAELYGIGKAKGSRLPLVLIPTTAGTGSEVTNISILTTGKTTKMGIVSTQLFADFVLLDAALTVGLPSIHTAATGIDAMVHAIESYTSRHKKNPVSDSLACSALQLLAANLVTACKDGTDRAAREKMLLGAMLAGQAFANSPVAAVHALAYPLGGHFRIAHGLSNALMLAPVLRFNAKVATPHYAELGAVLGVTTEGSAEARSEAFINHLGKLVEKSGAPRRLRDVGVPLESLPLLAEDAMKQTRLLMNNPVDLTQDDALALYHEAF